MKKGKLIKNEKPELLAPAGSLEKMKIAFAFGADAVYFGLPDFSLRVRINQFKESDIRKAAKYCQKHGKKFYVTLNIYAHEHHLKQLPKHLELIKEIKPDAVIVSDPGIINVIKRQLKNQSIHLSTQANATNSEAVKFWGDQGIERVILAREVGLEEIKEIKKEASGVELEYFIHGAMCMSYSGRCILSKWMTGRSANLGDCAQPCRWKYRPTKKMSVVDDKDRFEIDLEEDSHGTYFFNSHDMCLIRQVRNLMDTGIDSLKIEGRAKSVYYLAVVVRAYRKVIDAAWEIKQGAIKKTEYEDVLNGSEKDLQELTNRGYSEGFLDGQEPGHLFSRPAKEGRMEFVGISDQKINSKRRDVFVHNSLRISDKLQAISPGDDKPVKVLRIFDEEEEVASAHGGQGKFFQVEFNKELKGLILLKRKNKRN